MYSYTAFVGRIVKEVDLHYGNSGVAVGKFRLAVPRDQKKEGEPDTDFFSIICFKKTAEYASEYCKGGDTIDVAGRLQNREYTGNDGITKQVTELIADRLHILKHKDEKASTGKTDTSSGTKESTGPKNQGFEDPFADP